MKRFFTLAFLLAIVAVLAVPMTALAATGTMSVGGSVAGSTISIVTPSAIAFGTMKVANSPIEVSSGIPGKITVVPGTAGYDDWQCTAKCLTGTKMMSAGNPLTWQLLIKEKVQTYSGTNKWYEAGGAGVANATFGPGGQPTSDVSAGTLTYAYTGGSVTDLTFSAKQYIVAADEVNTGTYSIVITFEATLTGS